MSGDQNNAKIGSAIASVAAATVNGYLLNAVKRQRVPKAEGGRGTRRRIDMVTSAAIPSSAAFDGVVDVNDWDEVELPTCVQVKKVESCGVKDEQMEVPIEANPPVTKVEVVGEQGTVNNQEMKVDGAHAKSKLLANDAPEPSHAEVMDIDGASPPLAQGGWRPTDPCYTSMVEQRDLLAAQRRSERMQVICESTTEMLVMLNRGRTVWRESRHPALLKLLLRIDRGEYDSHPTTSTGEDSSAFLSTSGSGPCRSVIQAVKFASKCFRESQEASEKRLTLAPCWITPTKDAVKNRTSEGVTALLHTLNSVFSLSVASTEEGAPTVYRWNTVLEPQFLVGTLKEAVLHPLQSSIALPNSIYFCALFISLATAAGFSCRLMVARDDGRKKGTEEAPEGGERPSDVPLEKMSIFLPRKKAKTAAPKKGSREAESIHSKRMPTSCYWVEVWSEERESFLSVNPCAGCTTMWGAPYTFSISGDTVVDATPRYTSKMSSSYGFGRRLGSCKELRLLWKNQISWDDPREISDIVTSKFCSSKRSALGQRQQTRETKQLESLRFSETVPNTLGSLQKHPLFVIESYLARHEAVYPKDATTIVGSVKGNTVYKRSAVVVLRSRDGWLREGRGLTSDEVPYKTVSPPASRPFASPSQLFGHWQTKPFEPLPLLEDGSIPTHGRTHWYILLDKLCPPSVSHMKEPQIIKVARRMRLDFRLAVTGFLRRQPQENRRGHWEAVIEGIVVRTSDRSALLHAYSDWIQLVQEQEAARRKDRAYRWWLFLAQRLLAMERLEAQYMRGVALGGLPKY